MLEDIAVEAIEAREQLREVAANALDIQALAASVRAHGIQQPLAAYRQDGRVILLFGHRRLAAAKLAGLKAVPVQVHEGALDPGVIVKAQLAENMNRTDLSPIQEAEAYANVMRLTAMSAREVAREYGRSEAHVSKTLKLLTLPEAVKAMLARQEIPWSAAYELVQVADSDEQLRLAKQLAERRLTRDALRGAIKRGSRNSASPRARGSVRAVAVLESGRSVTVAGVDLTIDSVIETVEEYLARLRKARTKGWSLPTLIRALKDQARA